MPTRPSAGRRRARARHVGGPLRALAVANARYWPSVAPRVRRELEWCTLQARAIPDDELRELAFAKLTGERFNAEVAATLATIAPRHTRGPVIAAIVALELLFDYLDGRTEQPSSDPLGDSALMFGAFTAAAGLEGDRDAQRSSALLDEGYLWELSRRTSRSWRPLPGAGAVATVAARAAQRCAEAQSRLHAAATLGDEQLREWAIAGSRGTGLGWREFAGGGASSVLSMHALIATAASSGTAETDAERIDAAYLAMGGLITALDSLVDRAADLARGDRGFVRLYETPELLAERLGALAREALARTREAPDADHHTMTLAGVVAYYATHPGARGPQARTVTSIVRRELSPTIWPTLTVMRSWRGAKRARRLVAPRSARP